MSIKIPSIQETKSDDFFQPYVGTMKKIFAEFLGWSEAQTMAYIEQRLLNEGFRMWFGHDTPCDDASWLLIPETTKSKLRGVPLIRLHERIWEVLEGRGDTYNMFPDTDLYYDWQRAKDEVADILREYETSSKDAA